MSTPRSLPSDLTIVSLGALRAEWLATLPPKPEVVPDGAEGREAWPIDGSRVDEVDAAGVQFLLSLAHALQARHHALQLRDPSGPLAGACRALGVAAPLGIPTEAAA